MNGKDSVIRQHQGFSAFKFVFLGFVFFIFLNLIFIDWLLFLEPNSNIGQKLAIFNPAVSPTAEKPLIEENDICPQSCVAQIHEATASYKPISQPTLVTTSKTAPVSTSKVKEFLVSFGSGSSLASDWQDVVGLQTYIDTANYEVIKNVTFEASVRIPTGNQTAYVRLFNKTDKHPVWFSEVSLTGGTPSLLTSEPITLDKGNKIYQVQMKTQLQFQAILDQARVRITTN